MSLFVDPDRITVARAVAEQELRQGGCGCRFADDVTEPCPWHTLLGLLQPSVEAYETPWTGAA